ncbi:nucleotidyltransferase family protein [Algoriphagus sediminis]|uniref:Nucleotidyltransferase family protein n=1 Tax=Algoriphagus sediminis TaxID=3057113 RepID=A0ABT7YFH9_9BACT|nr:nucleotidyltransferase family protein [Algoriphagus sediminis]MDN3205243.1 nucleotidyltransferase family protein [Algoriphagus sediminis]
MPELSIVLLAAGSSSRMGSPKALLDWGDQSLVAYQIQKLTQLDFPIHLILGYEGENIKRQTHQLPTKSLINPHWSEGMGNSMAFSMEELEESDAALFFLVDQPLITVLDLKRLIDQHKRNPEAIIVSKSKEGWSGPPVIFPKKYFGGIKELRGDLGAKPLVKKHKDKVIFVELESSMDDMDTPEAYRKLLSKANLRS